MRPCTVGKSPGKRTRFRFYHLWNVVHALVGDSQRFTTYLDRERPPLRFMSEMDPETLTLLRRYDCTAAFPDEFEFFLFNDPPIGRFRTSGPGGEASSTSNVARDNVTVFSHSKPVNSEVTSLGRLCVRCIMATQTSG